jgi:hypothetical protein
VRDLIARADEKSGFSAWRLLGGMFGVQPDARWAATVMTVQFQSGDGYAHPREHGDDDRPD